MPETIICPDGARITCAIADIAEIMRSPSDFAWLSSVWIPLLAALASTAVATVSALIAKRARDMSRASEEARLSAEKQRVRTEQQQRLDSAIRDLFVGIATLMDETASVEEANNEAFREWTKPKGEGDWPGLKRISSPTSSGVRALIAAAKLEAHDAQERKMLAEVEQRVRASDGLSSNSRTAALTAVWEFVVAWRHTSNIGNNVALNDGIGDPVNPSSATI